MFIIIHWPSWYLLNAVHNCFYIHPIIAIAFESDNLHWIEDVFLYKLSEKWMVEKSTIETRQSFAVTGCEYYTHNTLRLCPDNVLCNLSLRHCTSHQILYMRQPHHCLLLWSQSCEAWNHVSCQRTSTTKLAGRLPLRLIRVPPIS